MKTRYDLTNCPDDKQWSGAGPVPAIGARVKVTCNGLGMGTVESYFFEDEYLGVRVRLDEQPAWHAKQRPGKPWALVFGLEVNNGRATE